ncbi:MAG: ABC transporter permease, partial [Alphaproteobacteria bacterium]|nr:ABC transporter permease [Alphaproteobacteria bacterium]
FPSFVGLAYVWVLTLVIGTFTLRAFRRVKGYLHSAI